MNLYRYIEDICSENSDNEDEDEEEMLDIFEQMEHL